MKQALETFQHQPGTDQHHQAYCDLAHDQCRATTGVPAPGCPWIATFPQCFTEPDVGILQGRIQAKKKTRYERNRQSEEQYRCIQMDLRLTWQRLSRMRHK